MEVDPSWLWDPNAPWFSGPLAGELEAWYREWGLSLDELVAYVDPVVFAQAVVDRLVVPVRVLPVMSWHHGPSREVLVGSSHRRSVPPMGELVPVVVSGAEVREVITATFPRREPGWLALFAAVKFQLDGDYHAARLVSDPLAGSVPDWQLLLAAEQVWGWRTVPGVGSRRRRRVGVLLAEVLAVVALLDVPDATAVIPR